MMTNETLKPCPKCGTIPIVDIAFPKVFHPQLSRPYCVWCPNCKNIFGYEEPYGGIFDTEDEAAIAWNKSVDENE